MNHLPRVGAWYGQRFLAGAADSETVREWICRCTRYWIPPYLRRYLRDPGTSRLVIITLPLPGRKIDLRSPGPPPYRPITAAPAGRTPPPLLISSPP